MGKTILLALLIIAHAGFSQQINTPGFLTNGKSIIQFYEFERAIQRNEETAALYMASITETDWKSDRKTLGICIKEEKELKKKIETAKVEVRYASYKKRILGLLDLIIKCFDNLYNYGPQSEQFSKSNTAYQPKLQAHLDTLVSLFGRDGYLRIDSAQSVEMKRKAYEVPFPEKVQAEKLLADKDPKAAYELILTDKSNLDNDAALLCLADILLKKKNKDVYAFDDADSLGVSFLNKIISKNAYSPFLYEAWRKWRAAKQMEYGASKTSDIPNDLYDKARGRLLEIIFDHIKNNPPDAWAYVQFFNLNEAEIIHRYGDYPYGNQSAIERYELFYMD